MREKARSTAFVVLVTLCGVAVPFDGMAQSADATAMTTVSGVLLGAYSGTLLGLAGSLAPCNRTLLGSSCAALAAGSGGTVALVMGGILGAQNPDALNDRFADAGVGALVGAVVGTGLRFGVQQYGWADALAVAAVGGAVGAAPRGAWIGATVGLAAGGVGWLILPEGGPDDLVMLTLAGLAVGGLYDWTAAAVGADAEREPTTVIAFSLSIG